MGRVRSRRAGFTLIELMIVVAIVGVLSATAISKFWTFQLRSKTVEAETNLAALRTAEEGYFGEYGIYLGTGVQAPAGAPSAAKRPWPVPAVDFDTLGWAPEGDVYFVYRATALGGAYSLGAQGDLDQGGATADFGYIHLDPNGNNAGDPFGQGCVGGVYNPSAPASPLADTVGPCSQTDGHSEF